MRGQNTQGRVYQAPLSTRDCAWDHTRPLISRRMWSAAGQQRAHVVQSHNTGQQGSSEHLVQHLALAVAQLVEERLVGRALLHGVADLVEVLRAGELVVAVRVQQPKVAVQLAPVVARQLRADRVQRDVQRPPVSL